MNSVAIIIVFITKNIFEPFNSDPMKKIDVNKLIMRIFAYSAMKINANIPPLYSTLNPDTNSDSPSAKSNGVRLVSAKLVINHIIDKGKIINIIHDVKFEEIIDKSICIFKIKGVNKMIDILTSYEIVCAIPRRAPNKAYFELEHHPAIKVLYTFILDTHKK